MKEKITKKKKNIAALKKWKKQTIYVKKYSDNHKNWRIFHGCKLRKR